MISSTSSTDINVHTVLICVSRQPASVVPRPEVMGRARALADPEYPSAAVIEYLTQQIIAGIFGELGSDLEKYQD